MRKLIFVTGHHRAGTHELSDYLESELKIPKVNEDLYMFDSMEILDLLLEGKMNHWGNKGKEVRFYPAFMDKGFILQCPGLACYVPRLAELGDVYWCYRNPEHIALSMANGGFNNMLWDIMKSFRKQYPDDPIWPTLKYNDREDPHAGFIGYAYLLTHVKEYFYEKYFKGLVKQRVILEEQPYYDFKTTTASKRPMRGQMPDRIKKVRTENESICVY